MKVSVHSGIHSTIQPHKCIYGLVVKILSFSFDKSHDLCIWNNNRHHLYLICNIKTTFPASLHSLLRCYKNLKGRCWSQISTVSEKTNYISCLLQKVSHAAAPLPSSHHAATPFSAHMQLQKQWSCNITQTQRGDVGDGAQCHVLSRVHTQRGLRVWIDRPPCKAVWKGAVE